jgi:nitrile hydratase subunit beta
MNGAHDCGGMMGFGPVAVERNEPVFHSAWEARVFALMSAVGDIGGWTLDEDRRACEAMHPADYAATSYYEHWLHGLQKLLLKHGLVTAEELADGRCRATPVAKEPTPAPAVWGLVTAPGSYAREPQGPARYAVGDRVRIPRLNPAGHTRLPRYLRGHAGEIIARHGAHVFPDSNAAGRGEDPRWLYTVRFTCAEVWGTATRDTIHADLWEPYLEAV